MVNSRMVKTESRKLVNKNQLTMLSSAETEAVSATSADKRMVFIAGMLI